MYTVRPPPRCQACVATTDHVRRHFVNLVCAAATAGLDEPVLLVPDMLLSDHDTCNALLALAACSGKRNVVQAVCQARSGLDYDTALTCASFHGHVPILRDLRDSVDPVARDCEALLVAARCGHQEVVRELLHWLAADRRRDDLCGLTPFMLWRVAHEAVAHGSWPLCTFVRRQLADLEVYCKTADLVVTAATCGRVPIMMRLHAEMLDSPSQYMRIIPDFFVPAVLAAARAGQVPVLRCLWSHYKDSFSVCNTMPQALHAAIQRGHEATAECLLRMMYRTAAAATPWTAGDAERRKPKPQVQLLHDAARSGFLALVRWLCERPRWQGGVRGSAGRNGALVSAAQWGHLPVVQFLCELPTRHGVRACARGNAALRWAVRGNYVDLVRYLCALPLAWHQVDPTFDGHLALWTVCRGGVGITPMLRTFLTLPASRGVDPTAHDGDLLKQYLGVQPWQAHAAQWLWESPPMLARSARRDVGGIMNRLAFSLFQHIHMSFPDRVAKWTTFARWLRAWPGADTFMDVEHETTHPFTTQCLRWLALRQFRGSRGPLVFVTRRQRWRRRRPLLLLRLLRDRRRAAPHSSA